MDNLVEVFENDWKSSMEPEEDNKQLLAKLLADDLITTTTWSTPTARKKSRKEETLVLGKQNRIFTNVERLLEFSKLRHSRSMSMVRSIPVDVMRIIKRYIGGPRIIVVLYETKSKTTAVLAMDVDVYPFWCHVDSVDLKRLLPLSGVASRQLPFQCRRYLYKTATTYSRDATYLLTYIDPSTYPPPCPLCVDGILDPNFHCCCLCPRFFVKHSLGPVRDWQELEHPRGVSTGFTLTYFRNSIYKIGGIDLQNHHFVGRCDCGNVATNAVNRFDIESGKWVCGFPLPQARANHVAAVAHDTLFVLGGDSGSAVLGYKAHNTVYQLQDEQRGWTDVSVLWGLPTGQSRLLDAFAI
jgi:hypothetical protein